jgi:tyrosyl-tRNA synthetase
VTPSPAEQLARVTRGIVEVHTRDELAAKLQAAAAAGRPLRVKLGLDPTAPDIHLGHTVVLRKLRQFQDLGHQAVLIIGDYTARVGDPSGRNRTRPPLNDAQIERHLETYLDQVRAVLDVRNLEIRRNGEWFGRMSFADVLKLAGSATVARMLERDDFAKRYGAGTPIGLHELLYPLMQARDSVEVAADVELGGTDQTFNLLAGRDLQRACGQQQPQVAITMPLLVGLDGTDKMSKSLGNYVGVTEPPAEMFGKLMSIPDRLMSNYFTLLTDMPEGEISTVLSGHPRQAKERLAREIVTGFHSAEAAAEAGAEFRRVFSEHALPEDIPDLELAPVPLNILDLLVAAGHARSKTEARRLIEAGSVHLNDRPMTDWRTTVTPADGAVLRTGKRRFARLRRRA